MNPGSELNNIKINKYFLLMGFLVSLNSYIQTKELRLKSPSKSLVLEIINDDTGLNSELINSKEAILEIDSEAYFVPLG